MWRLAEGAETCRVLALWALHMKHTRFNRKKNASAAAILGLPVTVATTIRMDRSLCVLCHPWIGNADTHSTWRIYNRVAITHLLHRMSQKRTYYIIYGIRPSNTITAEGLEDKWVHQLQGHSWVHHKRPSAPYSSSEKSATWHVAAWNGSAHRIWSQDNTIEQVTE